MDQVVTQATSIPGSEVNSDLRSYFAAQEREQSPTAPAPASPAAPATSGTQQAPDPAADVRQQKEVDSILDRWEKSHGDEMTPGTSKDPLSGTPFEGIPTDHPVVQWAIQQAEQSQWQQTTSEMARTLAQSGMPQSLIPEMVKFMGQVRGVMQRNQQLETMLQKIDRSDMVISTQAQRLAAQYSRYGVTAEDLVRAKPSSAKEMENLAKVIAVHNRRSAVGTRADEGRDRFESTGHGSPQNDIMDMTKPGINILRQAFR